MGRIGAGLLRLVILTALVGAGCTSGSSDASPPRDALPDGFHTVPGTRLLGAPIPEILFGDLGVGEPDPHRRQWSAFLVVEGHGRRVYDALSAQVPRHGIPPMESSETACRSRRPQDAGHPIGSDDLRCSATSMLPDHSKSFSVSVQLCSRCQPKVSAARVEYFAASSSRGGVSDWTSLEPAPAPPPNGKEPFGRHGARYPVHTSTKVLGRSLAVCSASGGPVLLTVTGDPGRVWADYDAAFEAQGRVLGRARAVFDGRDIREIAIAPTDYSAQVTLIEGRGLERPVLAYESCG